jgi:cell division septation protein DedD
MFIITADLVKPVNSDELPKMKGVDGLRNGSPLGVEPAGGDGISGNSGFSSGTDGAAANAPKTPTLVPAVPLPATTPATTTPATTTPAAPANGAPATDTGAKTAPQPAGTPGTTKGATP